MKKKNTDEELHKVNKRIKEHSKALNLPVNHRTEILIKSELSMVHRLLQGPIMPKIHAATYVAALGMLTFLLGFPRMFFVHAIYAALLLWVTESLHRRGDLTVKVFYTGLMILPLYLIYLKYNDLLSLVMTVTFAISFVVTAALYFHHSKKGMKRELHSSFSRTFMTEWYAHVLSLTIAATMIYYLPSIIFMDSFYSLLHIILFWVTPSAFVYYFMNKFIYLRFFDPLHARKDAIQALKHAVAYTALLTGCLTLGYLLTSVQLSMQVKDINFEYIDNGIAELNSAEIRMLALPYGVQDLEVTKEIKGEIATIRKALEDRRTFRNYGVADYFSDDYFSDLVSRREAINFLVINKDATIRTADDLIRDQDKTGDRNTVDQSYSPYQESTDLRDYRLHLQKSMNRYDLLMFDDSLFSFVHSYSEDTGIQIFAPGYSRISKKTYYVTSHLKIFRDMLLYSFNKILYTARSSQNPEILDKLYYNKDKAESQRSKDVRYAILQDNL